MESIYIEIKCCFNLGEKLFSQGFTFIRSVFSKNLQLTSGLVCLAVGVVEWFDFAVLRCHLSGFFGAFGGFSVGSFAAFGSISVPHL